MENFLSLYDYLKRPAGRELGIQVSQAAQEANIPTQHKIVNNSTYSGPIQMYPENWLDSYFGNGAKSSTEILYNEPDDLPF
jgi:hypothetical protein